jgi:signal transduction histidine kinase
MVGTLSDITERKRLEAERERLNQELDQKNHELQNVLYAASHDLRSPLITIQGFSKRLDDACGELTRQLDQPEIDRTAVAPLVREQIPKALGFIRTSGAKMDSLISGMLRLSRLGQVLLRPERLEMNQLVQQTLATLAIQIQTAGATIETDPLPPCTGDAGLIGQVFANLLDNAIKYRDSTRPLSIHLTGQTEAGCVVYGVADNGTGLTPADQERIWELFRRVNPGKQPGEGLGLNLVRRIVERHNGRVWVKSKLGEGSCFFVELRTPISNPPPVA